MGILCLLRHILHLCTGRAKYKSTQGKRDRVLAMTQAQADAIEAEMDEEEAWDEMCEWLREFGEDF